MYSEIIRICGIGESAMEEMVSDIMAESINPTVAPYAKTGECRLRVTAKAESADKAAALTAPVVKKLVSRLGEFVYTVGNDSLAKTVAKILIEKKLTISGAESCTGGIVVSMLAECPGVSAVLNESFVTYSNDSKTWLLGVSPSTLDKYGAVSVECAKEMAEGLSSRSGVDVAFAVTGIAGPDGGSEQKPVGTVCFGLRYNGRTIIKIQKFNGDRTVIQTRASIFMLDMIRKEIQRSIII